MSNALTVPNVEVAEAPATEEEVPASLAEVEEEAPKESKEKQDTVSTGGGKQRKSPSNNDDTDRQSFSSKNGPQDSTGANRKERSQSIKSDKAPSTIPVASQPVFPPPWPEWSDDFINEETWDVDSGIDYFEDIFAATDYLNMKAYHWMRPSEFLREPPSVVKFSSSVVDLITPNAHLCEKSEALRYILSEISELYDYSIQNKFVECEGEGVIYVPNYAEDDRRWTPWNHIYSCCKAGVRGEKPIYNSRGKYYVRLYFMGTWRRILVDDRIPVLPSGQSGLPLTEFNELWPLLLTKALLKVASVTWKDDDVKKFSAVSAMTGWVFEWVDNIDGVNEDDLWADLQNTLPKYVDPKKIPSCYTLLHPSHKKQKFGSVEESDTFWWMPNIAVHISELEDRDLVEELVDDEPFDLDPRDVVSPKDNLEMDETGEHVEKRTTFLEVKWQRKTVPPPISSTRRHGSTLHIYKETTGMGKNLFDNTLGVPGDENANAEEAAEEKAEKADAATVMKKKKKKGGLNAAMEDAKSEKKSVGKKHKKAPKDEETKGKSKVDMKKRSKMVPASEVLAANQALEAANAEEEEDPNASAGKKGGKSKNTHGWNKLKNIVLGDALEHMSARMSKSLRRSFLEKSEIIKAASQQLEVVPPIKGRKSKRRIPKNEDDSMPTIITDDMDESMARKPKGLPSLPEILYGVQKYNGLDYRNIVKNWENLCGKDSPISLMVVLKQFPRAEEEDSIPFVPAFLQHPIQLVEVRDTVLQKITDRPETPLWKRFRWKKWAMKKGLIPLEEDHSQDIIRAVKAKTPFVFKNDWFDYSAENLEYEEEDEFEGEEPDDDDFYGSGDFFGLGLTISGKETETQTPAAASTTPVIIPPIAPVPPTPPPTKEQLTPSLKEKDTIKTIAPTQNSRISKVSDNARQTGPTNLLTPDIEKESVRKRSMAKSTRDGRQPSQMTQMTAMEAPDTILPVPSLLERHSMEGTGGGSNPVLVIHETEVLQGESEEDFDESFKRKMLVSNVQATAACASLWFNSDDIARNLRKFCKFYTSQSIFGSCYILRREPKIPLPINSVFYELHSELPKYPENLTDYKQKRDVLNVGIEFDRYKSYNVADYHLDNEEGIESAFYLFSDCWTEQEIIVTVHVLQDDSVKPYNDLTSENLTSEMPGPPPTPMSRGGINSSPNVPPNENLSLTLVIEPWDWRYDTCLAHPLLLCTWINDRWISHINLPAGRNTFRVWLLYQETHPKKAPKKHVHGVHGVRSQTMTPPLDPEELMAKHNEFLQKKNSLPFSVRIVSQTPVYVGSRSEVLNYMTNPPTLFLKQCERMANNIWGLFACFGKQRSAFYQNLRQLRKSYCPSYSQPNMINKFNKAAHDTFEELFVSLVTQFNDGKLDRMLVMALRVLFVNPMIGRRFGPPEYHVTRSDFFAAFKALSKKTRNILTNAVVTVQRFYRGWRVRRLFQLRRRNHPDFKRVEYHLRRIALLLAKETDSIFAVKNPITGQYGEVADAEKLDVISVVDMTVDPEKVPPTILPSPPHWSVDLLKFLMKSHPWLVAIHPHANCEPHHVKITELEGELPVNIKDFSWYPFFREKLAVPPFEKSCFVEIDLQVYPTVGTIMKIINNDTGKYLHTVTNRMFIGRLFENKHGYTVLCFRWAVPSQKQELNDRPASKLWKLRLITPREQEGPKFQTKAEHLAEVFSGENVTAESNNNNDTAEEEAKMDSYPHPEKDNERTNSLLNPDTEPEDFPKKLTLRRLTGYYTPNKDYSVCQYIMETEEKRTTVSLRFHVSNPNVQLRIHIWDCAKKLVIFDEVCKKGLIAPCIQLYLAKPRPKSQTPEEAESPTEIRSATALHSPISEELGSTNSGLLTKVMSTNMISNSKVSMIDDEEEMEEDFNENRSSKGSASEMSIKDKEKKSTESTPPIRPKRVTNKRRYIISVYVVDDSWQLSDRELLYVLYRERKFFRGIKAHHCKDVEKMRVDEKKRKEEEAREAAAQAEAAAAEGGRGSLDGEPTPPETPTLSVPTPANPREPTVTAKRKTKRKDGGEKGIPLLTVENTAKANNNTLAVPATSDNETTTVFPPTPPPTTTSTSNIAIEVPPFGDDAKKEGKKQPSTEITKIKRRMTGSLQVKYGGHQSQTVKHLDQPHWVLEIVTQTNVKYKLKSNWQILRKRLLLARESWESGGIEVIYQELSTRLDYLLENMLEDNYHNLAHHKLSIVDPMANLFSCLRMDEYNYHGFGNHEFMNLLIQAWSPDPEERKKAGEKFLQNRRKSLIIFNDDLLAEPPKPEELLDYIPTNLRKLAQNIQHRIEEREVERERQARLSKVKLIFSEHEDEEEYEEEEEDEAPAAVGPTGSVSTAPGTERGTRFIPHPDEGELEATGSHVGIPKLGRKTNTDAKTERTGTRKGKNKGQQQLPTTPSETQNPKVATRKQKNDTRRSINPLLLQQTNDPVLMDLPFANNNKRNSARTENGGGGAGSRKSAGTVSTKDKDLEEQPKDNYETELDRMRSCTLIADILKEWEKLFKEPKSFREALLEKIEQEQKLRLGDDKGPQKLLLTKTGISTYAEKTEKTASTITRASAITSGEVERDNKMEHVVGNKLLKWAYDYSCLPPTEEHDEVIEDPGELPLFIMRTIMERQLAREREEEMLRAAALAAEEEKLGEDE